MALTLQGTAAGTTSLTIPTHSVGDLIVMMVFRGSDSILPTIPAEDWTTFQSSVDGENASMVVWKIADSTSEVTGTFTNASRMYCWVFSGADTTTPLGGYSFNWSDAADDVTYGGITMDQPGVGWVLGGCHVRLDDLDAYTPPTGMTNRHTAGSSAGRGSSHDTNGAAASWTTQTVNITNLTDARYHSWVVEVRAASSINSGDGSASGSATVSGAVTKRDDGLFIISNRLRAYNPQYRTPWDAHPAAALTFEEAWGFRTEGGAGASDGVATAAAEGADATAGTVESGDGAAAGVAAGSGVGASIFAGDGSAAGVAAGSGVGASIFAGAGASAGIATASATGASTYAGAGAATGVATGSGVGASTSAASGSAAGVATASAVGSAATSAEGDGAASGVATVSATGASIAAGDGSSSCIGTGSGIGASIASGVGASDGVGATSGVGASIAEAVGASAGEASASATGRWVVAASGSSDGTSTASAIGVNLGIGVGTASGSASASATSVEARIMWPSMMYA